LVTIVIMEKVPMTSEGLRSLEDEVKNLKSVERPAIIKAIAAAREHGDISENAEYTAAREHLRLTPRLPTSSGDAEFHYLIHTSGCFAVPGASGCSEAAFSLVRSIRSFTTSRRWRS
jgi:hypothetical protein